ncbi:transposon Tf2-9 polyprotein [Trichonephila clavipes]|nr:transposon Tf2-9 polyprotein [Trichonephila clavipes]
MCIVNAEPARTLASPPVLPLYDENAPTELHTDASDYGTGAILVQQQDGKERVIAYASRTLTKAEKNYSTIDRECLAAIWAITKFRPYLFGKCFSIMTDHHSLCWLANPRDPSDRLARWALRLQEFDVSILFKRGKKPDSTEQRDDPSLAAFIKACEQSPDLWRAGFSIKNNVLCKKKFDPSGKQCLPVVPKKMRLEILHHFHDEPTAGHLGLVRTYDRIRKRFFWPRLFRTVRRYVIHCRECQRRKVVPLKPPAALIPIPPGEAPFQRIGMDLLGRFPKSQGGNRWISVCTDYMKRYAITKVLPTAEAPEVEKFFVEEIILTHAELQGPSSPIEAQTFSRTSSPRLPITRLVTQAEESRQLARIRTLEAQEKDQRHYNSRHRAVLYQPGDLVWIYILVRKIGRCEKRLKKYCGAYQVLRKLLDVTYEVHDFDPTSRRRKSKDIVHVIRRKPYYDPDLQAHFNDTVASDGRRFGESTSSTERNDYTGSTTHSRSKALRQTR